MSVNKEDKGCIVFLAIILISFVLTFGIMVIKYAKQPTHTVKVDYTIYTYSGPVQKCGVYEMKGESFTSFHESHRGSNTVSICCKSRYFGYCGKQIVIIYTGTSDVYVNSIKILE